LYSPDPTWDLCTNKKQKSTWDEICDHIFNFTQNGEAKQAKTEQNAPSVGQRRTAEGELHQ